MDHSSQFHQGSIPKVLNLKKKIHYLFVSKWDVFPENYSL